VLRALPWFRILLIAQLALLAKRHLERLEAAERTELRRLVAKSHGRPRKHLTERERDRLAALVAKLEPAEFGKVAAGKVIGYRRR
jgi:predicted ArsR family transcriptional regulator